MIRFGNRNLLISDSKFGTNKLKYPIHSLLVFSSDKKALPVAWIITPTYVIKILIEQFRPQILIVRSSPAEANMWGLAGFQVKKFSSRMTWHCLY
ncbi:hypothetical protein K1719_041865 [Acacia pycnantha]|nr:hypothetical protein K1719_041865 [Acacia pycnantha]